MSTVSTVLTSARYDLRDTNSSRYLYSNAELMDYLNRAIRVLDAELRGLNSDWVHQQTTLSISTNASTVSQAAGWAAVRSLWIGDDEITKKSLDYINAKRKSVTAAGQPDYYAQNGVTLIFERRSNNDYTITSHIDKFAPLIASTGDPMPFNGEFDDPLMASVILLAKNRNELSLVTDAVLHDLFKSASMKNVIKRNFVPKRRHLGF